MKHYVLLKFKPNYYNKDVLDFTKNIFYKIKDSLDGILNVKVFNNCVERNSNMDIMIEMELKDEDVLVEYLKHELHMKFVSVVNEHLVIKVSFDHNDDRGATGDGSR